MNRIEGRTGRDLRATTEYENPQRLLKHYLRLHKDHIHGAHGFCQ